MSGYIGDYSASATVGFEFEMRFNGELADFDDVPAPAIGLLQDGVDIGDMALSRAIGGKLGINYISVGPLAGGHNYRAFVRTGTVGGINRANELLDQWSVENRSGAAVDLTPVLEELDAIKAVTDQLDPALINSKLALISAGGFAVVDGPVTKDLDLELVPGASYLAIPHGLALTISYAERDMSNTTPTLVVTDGDQVVFSVDGTVSNPGTENQTLIFGFAPAVSALLLREGSDAYRHQINALWPADDPAQPTRLFEGAVRVLQKMAA